MPIRLFATVSAVALLTLAACSKPASPAEKAAPAAPAPAAEPAAPAAPAAAAMSATGNTLLAESTSPPGLQAVGACEETTLVDIGGRLEGMPDSGTSIDYANHASQVSYDVIPEAKQSKPGDKVKLCVTEVPADCPAGDDRGFVYSAVNARTGKTWTAPNSQHMCGGA